MSFAIMSGKHFKIVINRYELQLICCEKNSGVHLLAFTLDRNLPLDACKCSCNTLYSPGFSYKLQWSKSNIQLDI